MSNSSSKPDIYKFKNNIADIVPAYAVSVFPRTMVGFQVNKLDASPNIIIHQQLMGTDGTVHTNHDGVLLSSTGFSELLLQLQGLEMVLNPKKCLPVNANDSVYTPQQQFNFDLQTAVRDLNHQLTKDAAMDTIPQEISPENFVPRTL